jgi:hypothetical protein
MAGGAGTTRRAAKRCRAGCTGAKNAIRLDVRARETEMNEGRLTDDEIDSLRRAEESDAQHRLIERQWRARKIRSSTPGKRAWLIASYAAGDLWQWIESKLDDLRDSLDEWKLSHPAALDFAPLLL